MKLAVCQLRTETDQDETLRKAEAMVTEAAENGAQLAVLPEMFNCPYAKKYFKPYAALGHEKTVSAMSRWAKDNGIILAGGSIPETDGGEIYNTAFVFDENGEIIAKHRKVHLFDIDVPGMRFRESSTFAPGTEITVFDTKYGRMGLAVCFDLRFPELFRSMAVRGAKLILLPAQFNMTTGPAHWELLLRARAVDNELFIAGASAARYEGFDYECWGHSTVTDPFGSVIAECDEKEQILYADIDFDRVDTVRQQLPTFLHLRRDVYTVSE
ncbi:MAG: carbon-nitrogen hydrolase family protein [Candidatus Limivicinus sp.]|jgi:omega-amidase